MIKVLIADDEKHAKLRLKKLLSAFGNFFIIIAEAENGDEAISKIIQKKPDVAFLDINMPGVSVFESIPSLKKPPLIVFQTAYEKFAVNAFGINALDYLLKPVSEERFSRTVDKIKKALEKDKFKIKRSKRVIEKISVKFQGTIKVIPIAEIFKISFEQGLSFIYTEKEKFIGDKYLNFYEKLLINQDFFRSSRNDLVNVKFISAIHPMFKGAFEIELMNRDRLKLSRRRATLLKKIVAI